MDHRTSEVAVVVLGEVKEDATCVPIIVRMGNKRYSVCFKVFLTESSDAEAGHPSHC